MQWTTYLYVDASTLFSLGGFRFKNSLSRLDSELSVDTRDTSSSYSRGESNGEKTGNNEGMSKKCVNI